MFRDNRECECEGLEAACFMAFRGIHAVYENTKIKQHFYLKPSFYFSFSN